MKKLFILFSIIVFVSGTVVSPCLAKAKKPKYKIKLSNVMPAVDHISLAYDKFAEFVDKNSNGEIKVLTFHGSQLGSGKETFEAARAGFIEIASDSYANIVTISPAFEPFHLPYIFESRQQALKAFKSPKIKARIDGMLADVGLKWLSVVEYGPRQMGTTKKKILWPDDLKGLKLRASRSPLEIATQKSFGAASVTIDWIEVVDAMRMGTVDGVTVTFADYYSNKIYEVVRFIGELSFEVFGNVAVCNKKWWDKLPPDVKKVLSESASEAEKWHEDMLTDYYNNAIKEMKAGGTEIFGYTPEQRKAFKGRAMKVWDQFANTTCPKDFVDLIIKEAGPPGKDAWGYVY